MTPEGFGRAVALQSRLRTRECLAVAMASLAARWLQATAVAVLGAPPVAIAWFILG